MYDHGDDLDHLEETLPAEVHDDSDNINSKAPFSADGFSNGFGDSFPFN